MPRSTKNSQASGGAASSSAAGEEQTVDGDNRKKLTQEEKARQRQQKQDFSKNMYAIAMAYLKEHLKRALKRRLFFPQQ